MRDNDADFGGEHSAHFYLREKERVVELRFAIFIFLVVKRSVINYKGLFNLCIYSVNIFMIV